MNTNHPAAPRTDPLFILFFHKRPYAEFLNIHQIFNHAHAIVCPIALVHTAQTFTGKLVAPEAVGDPFFYYLLAVLDQACNAGF